MTPALDMREAIRALRDAKGALDHGSLGIHPGSDIHKHITAALANVPESIQ